MHCTMKRLLINEKIAKIIYSRVSTNPFLENQKSNSNYPRTSHEIFEISKKQKCNGYLVKIFEFSTTAIINVNNSRMRSLPVEV